jgi:uncharacterized membrane protein YvbJ
MRFCRECGRELMRDEVDICRICLKGEPDEPQDRPERTQNTSERRIVIYP